MRHPTRLHPEVVRHPIVWRPARLALIVAVPLALVFLLAVGSWFASH